MSFFLQFKLDCKSLNIKRFFSQRNGYFRNRMQTPLIKEIYLHIHFVYWMRKVFFRNNRKFFNRLFQCTRMQFYLSNFSTWLTCYLILLSKILIIYIQKKRRLTAPLLNLLFLVAAFIGLFSLF